MANKAVFDPDTLANRIHADMKSSRSAIPDILAQPAESRVDSLGTRWHKDAVKAQKGKPATGIDMTTLWNQMTGETGIPANAAKETALHDTMRKMSPEKIIEKFKLKGSIPGTMNSTLNSRLSGAFKDDLAEKMLEKSKLTGMFTGAGKLRPGKAALLALLAGGWGLGAGVIRHKYRQDDSDRRHHLQVGLQRAQLPQINTLQSGASARAGWYRGVSSVG